MANQYEETWKLKWTKKEGWGERKEEKKQEASLPSVTWASVVVAQSTQRRRDAGVDGGCEVTSEVEFMQTHHNYTLSEHLKVSDFNSVEAGAGS